MVFRRDLPLHAFAWVRRLYSARAAGKGFVIEAFCGSSKTTSISIAFLAIRIGLNPQDSFLVLQATAAAARATCRQVADLITHDPGWHIAFPHVVPARVLDILEPSLPHPICARLESPQKHGAHPASAVKGAINDLNARANAVMQSSVSPLSPRSPASPSSPACPQSPASPQSPAGPHKSRKSRKSQESPIFPESRLSHILALDITVYHIVLSVAW